MRKRHDYAHDRQVDTQYQALANTVAKNESKRAGDYTDMLTELLSRKDNLMDKECAEGTVKQAWRESLKLKDFEDHAVAVMIEARNKLEEYHNKFCEVGDHLKFMMAMMSPTGSAYDNFRLTIIENEEFADSLKELADSLDTGAGNTQKTIDELENQLKF